MITRMILALTLSALLAAPACAGDPDAMGNSPPQPAPPASHSTAEERILADALVEVTAQYQTLLSAAGNRADEMHATYRHMIMLLVGVAGIVVGLFPYIQHRRFQRLAADHHTSERRIEDLTGQLEAQRVALAAQKTASDRATKALLRKTAAIYSNMAFTYLSSIGSHPLYGLVYVSNAVFTQNEAGNKEKFVMDPMDWWLEAAKRSTRRLPPGQVPAPELRASFSSLVDVGIQRKDRLFSRKLDAMENALKKLLEGDDKALGQVFEGPVSPDAQPGPATATGGTTGDET